MTPKEKAQELVDKFIEFTQDWDARDGYINDEFRAKECALIVVDELIDFAKLTDTTNDWDHLNYWQEIKQEIEKL